MQNKWKKNIKSQMQNREISPNPMIWEELEKQLDKNKRKSPSVIWWISGIAAGILVLFSIGVLMNNSEVQATLPLENNSITQTPPMEENKGLRKEEQKIIIPIEKDPSLSHPKKEKEKQLLIPSSRFVENDIKSKSEDVEKKLSTETILKEISQQDITSESILTTKNQYVTAEDLLASVEAEIAKGDTITDIKINSKELLGEVEDEIVEDKYPSLLDQFSKEVKKAQIVLREKIMN